MGERTFELRATVIPEWARLAWVARVLFESHRIELFLGPMVEHSSFGCVEGIWADDYSAFDFDRQDLFFGSGLRIRGETITGVSSNSSLDRLFSFAERDQTWVSNSLSALLGLTGLQFRVDDLSYRITLDRVKLGRKYFHDTLPTDRGEITFSFADNIVISPDGVTAVEKPQLAPPFLRYADYLQYLETSMKRLGENMRDPRRTRTFFSAAALSSGYDSAATAALSRHAGCRTALTLERARSFRGVSDSGLPIAKALGMVCEVYQRDSKNFQLEESVWSVMGDSQDLNLTIFDYPQPLSVLFTGFYGDMLWERDLSTDPTHEELGPVEDIVRDDTAGMSFAEHRLFRGVIQCPMAMWGVRRAGEIRNISQLPEMAPWTLGGFYDRPICRRILEEAGVPRGVFGVRKKATSVSDERLWPYAPQSRADFVSFLRERAKSSDLELALARVSSFANFVDRDILARIRDRFHISRRFGVEYWLRPNRLLFHWANDRLARVYRKGFERLMASNTGAVSERSV